uniref:G-protein coupled receptors family 1 profile domain-containing protein n=1 Tax=Ascaris lumbricoides TaxID=6252 RepID=A0A9J2Q4Q4_ASCLU
MVAISLSIAINVMCCFCAGLVLALVNIPVSYAVSLNKDLRIRYGIMLVLFFTCALDGIAGFLKAIYRAIVVLAAPDYGQITMNAEFCLLNPIILCDIYAFGANGILLFANSIDRLLVVSIPVKYYVHAKRIVLWEVFVTHSITISVFVITVFICAVNNNDNASIECRSNGLFSQQYGGSKSAGLNILLSHDPLLTGARWTRIEVGYTEVQPSYFPQSFRVGVACARALLSATSILTMGVVLLRSRAYGKENIAFVTDRKLATFKSRQQKFTRLTITSSIVTLALDVIPNCISAYAHLRNPSNTAVYTTYARYGSYLNAVNFTLMMSVGYKEIRNEVMTRFHLSNENLPCFKQTFNIHTTSIARQQRHTHNMNVNGACDTSGRTNQRQSAEAALPGTPDNGHAAIVQPNS